MNEFSYKLKVFYEDTDSGGVVYYANYLKFLERARTEALYSIGYSNKKVKDDFETLIIVKSCNIEYKKPSYLEDELSVRSFVKSISKTSFFMNQIITRGDDIIVSYLIKRTFQTSLKLTQGQFMFLPEGDVGLNKSKEHFTKRWNVIKKFQNIGWTD